MEVRVQMVWYAPDGKISEFSTPMVKDVDDISVYIGDKDWHVAPEVFAIQVPDLRSTAP